MTTTPKIDSAAGSRAGSRAPVPPATGESTRLVFTQGERAEGAGASVKSVLDLGMSFLGTPYKWGGSQPGGFDCSGLLQYIYGQKGVAIPRVAADQAKAGVGVTPKDAQPGDLIAFDNDPSRPGVDHIGIYLGGGKMLQAPHTGAVVQVVNVNLNRATAIRRVAGPQATVGLQQSADGHYVYSAKSTPGATKPTSITPAKGGGDIGNTQSGGLALGPDGKVDPAAALAAYGSIAELAKTVPDIQRVITQAIKDGLDPTTAVGQQIFQQRLSQTAWWKQTATKQRDNQVLKATDPRRWKENLKAYHDKIVVLARNLGVPMTDNAAIDKLAERAMNLGWDDSQIQRYVAADIKVGAGVQNTGQAAVTVDDLRTQASDWMVPISDATLQDWTRQILKGDVPAEAFGSYLREQAKSMFPGLSDAIDRGVTVKQYTDPYRQYAGQLLEIDPNSIDLVHDPKFSKAMFSTDPKTGQRAQMSLSDWQSYLRTTPDYNKTAQAVDQAANFAETLTKTFGAVA